MPLKIVNLEEYRRHRMIRKSATAKKDERTAAPPDGSRNRTIRMADETYEAWKFWNQQMNMSFDQSLRFFLSQHPVKIRVPKGIKITPEEKRS